jgi:excisionase family DNA binding protein
MVLTIEQAAALLHFAPGTVRRFALAGVLPATKIGRSWRFDENALLYWLSSRSLENVKPCPCVDVKVPRIGKSGFSSLDARLEALLEQPTGEKQNSSKRSFVVVTGGKLGSEKSTTPGTTL